MGESRYTIEDIKKIIENAKSTISELREKLSKKTFIKAIGGRRLAERLSLLLDLMDTAIEEYGVDLAKKYLEKRKGIPFREEGESS